MTLSRTPASCSDGARPRVALARDDARQLAAPLALGRSWTTSVRAAASPSSSSGVHQPAGLSVADDRRRAQRAGGDGRQAAGHALDDDLAELLALGGQHDERRRPTKNSGSSSWACQPARNTWGTPRRAAIWAGCSPSHSPGWPPTSTSPAGVSQPLLGAPERADQAVETLDGGEAPDVEQHRVPRPARRHRPRGSARFPAGWPGSQPRGCIDQDAAPERLAVTGARL